MSVTTSRQIFNQVLEPLAGSAVMHDAAILAFQLLAWAHLSAKEALDPADTLHAALDQGHGALIKALSKLAARSDLVGQAFNNSAAVARHADAQVMAAAKSAKGLVDAGVFERFFPADVAADLVPWIPGYETLSPQLVRLVAKLAFAEDVGSVYCPWEFSGQFVGSLLGTKPTRIHVECLHRFPLPALMALFHSHGGITVEFTDPLRAPAAVKAGQLEKFQATIACPPMGLRVDADLAARDLYARFPVPKATATGLMVQHIAAQTAGNAAIVVPNSFLFGPGTDREVREHLLRNKQVQAVVALPGGFLSNTNIPVAILVLNTQEICESVRFLDATQDYFRKPVSKNRSELINEDDILEFCRSTDEMDHYHSDVHERLGPALAVKIPVADVLENDAQLQVNRYVMSADRRRFQESLAARPSVELGTIANLIAPMANKDRDVHSEDALPVLEVGAADLPPTGYIQSASKELQIRRPKSSRGGNPDDIFLRPNDVVLITKGSAGKVGIVPADVPKPGPGGWIAGQSAVVLRAAEAKGDLRGLAVLLRSDRGQELLASITSGASIQMISLAALKNLLVPILAADVEARAVHALDRQAELQEQIDSLQREQAELTESLWADLLKN
jgi:type I restriction enzyme M protein